MTMLAVAGLFVIAALLAISGLVVFAWISALRAERLVPRIGRFAVVDGVRLHYLDQGTGTPIVMIHGLAAQLQSYTYALSDHLAASHRLVMVDRPGSGYSRTAGSATLKEQARLVAGLMDRLGIDRALIVGHSLGGAVALALAMDHPDRVAGLALLAPATQPQEEPPTALRSLAVRSDPLRWIFGWTLAVPFSLRHRDTLLEALFAPDRVLADFGTRGGALLLARPWTFRAACRDLVEAGGELGAYAARHDTIRAPVAVLFGDGDRILDPALHGEGLRRSLPDLEFETLAGSGHMLPLTRPADTAAFVERAAATADWKPPGTETTGPRPVLS